MVYDGMRQLASGKKPHDAALAAGYPCLTPSIATLYPKLSVI
jgi:hypothetical protein